MGERDRNDLDAGLAQILLQIHPASIALAALDDQRHLDARGSRHQPNRSRPDQRIEA